MGDSYVRRVIGDRWRGDQGSSWCDRLHINFAWRRAFRQPARATSPCDWPDCGWHPYLLCRSFLEMVSTETRDQHGEQTELACSRSNLVGYSNLYSHVFFIHSAWGGSNSSILSF